MQVFFDICVVLDLYLEKLIFGLGLGIFYYFGEQVLDFVVIVQIIGVEFDVFKVCFFDVWLVLELGCYLVGLVGYFVMQVVLVK